MGKRVLIESVDGAVLGGHAPAGRRRHDRARRRSGRAAQGLQERRRARRHPRRPSSRRRRRQPVPRAGSPHHRRAARCARSRSPIACRRCARRPASCATCRSTPSPAPARTARSCTITPRRRPSARSSRASLYLVDSGGQYRDGTTDITRTVAIGTPSAEMKRPLHPRAEGPYRARDRALPGRHDGLAARRARALRAVAGRARLRPRHRPRRRRLPLGARRARTASRRWPTTWRCSPA